MNDAKLDGAELHFVRITPKTCWTFVRLLARDGSLGEGEASLIGKEDELTSAAERLLPAALREASIDDPGAFADAQPLADRHSASIVSAVDQALWSLYAQSIGQSLADVLGVQRERVPVYANINRRTVSRDPQGFAASAQTAMSAGHVAFKIAPFDEVTPQVCEQGDGIEAMQPGLARIAAVRETVGAHARLMVDCHWRFDEQTATALNEAAAALNVYWIETPIPEVEANVAALARLRRQCNALGMRAAGLETSVRWDMLRPFCEGGCYDVVMPDMKYIGGIREMQRTVAECARMGIQIAPHNPSGPICHAASLHVSASIEAFDLLELQFDESPLFDELVGAPFAPVIDGHTTLPRDPGLGVALDPTVLQSHADRETRHWRR